MALGSSPGETKPLFYLQSSLCTVVSSLRTPFLGRSFDLAGIGSLLSHLHLESSLNDLLVGPLDYDSGIFRLCSPLEERHIWSSIRRPARDVREGYGLPLRGSSRSEGCGLSGTLRRGLAMRAASCEGCPRGYL
jgi:hypothetical protein